MKKLYIHTITTFFAAVLAFAVGVVIGISGGDMNARIDFCMDSTSGRYINNESAREDACE